MISLNAAGSAYHDGAERATTERTVVRCSRVLNYDMARWVTELRPQLSGKRHALVLDIDPVPLPAVLCDRTQLRQVVAHLVTAAHTFTDVGGQITVAAHAVGRVVRIEVRDTGGRGAASRARAFEPFARHIVEAHGGSIVVEIRPTGHTFAFTLPVHSGSSSSAGRAA